MASDHPIGYQSEIKYFHQLRDANIRQDIGGRAFVLVPNVTEALLQPCLQFGDKLSRLLWTAYDRIDNQAPQIKPTQLHSNLPVLYTLLDLDIGHRIHKFLDDNLTDLPIDKDRLGKVLDDELVEKFYERQWRWCPMVFSWRMYGKLEFQEYIVPIEARKRIEPSRDGLQKVDRKATIWIIEVPTELVDNPLKEKLRPSSNITRPDDGQQVSHHRFVVKQFSHDREHAFEREKSIFGAIGEKEGLVTCIGWYTDYEQHNLVLELGDQDLYSTFQKENPPVALIEIKAFWQSMFQVAVALASLQTHELYGRTYHVWHGDIKPENILSVGDSFKIADPGEAKMVKAETGKTSETQVPGGTRSFAAPEKLVYYSNGGTQERAVTQGSDIWSLGCVFSVAATYVVLGKEGVKQYRLLRNKAVAKIGLGIGDPFHNQREVLPEVLGWHKYLREVSRRADCYTPKVLDIVDLKMLVVPGQSRISGKELAQELEVLLMRVDCATQNIPSEITDILTEILSSSSQTRPVLDDVPRTISQSGEESLFREPILASSRRSDGRTPSFKSYSSEKQRRVNSNSDTAPGQRVQASSSSHSGFSNRQASPTKRLPEIITPDESKTVRSNDTTTSPYKLEAELNKHGKGTLGRRKSVRGISMGGIEDRMGRHFENRDIVFLVDNGSSMMNFWDEAKKILEILAWRALEYDDNGMELKFTCGKNLNLSPKKRQKVGDFLGKMDKAKPIAGLAVKTDMKTNLTLILEQHKREHPNLDRRLTVLILTDGVWEGMNNEYEVDNCLIDFLLRVNEILASNTSQPLNTSNAPGDSCTQPQDRPTSIQFVQFGHDAKATERLTRLDNDLQNYPALAGLVIRDIVDTEHAAGDAYKMLLGSLSDNLDNQTTPGTPVISPPPSSVSFLPSPRHAESRTASPPSANYLTSGHVFDHEIYAVQARQRRDNDRGSYHDTPDPQETSTSDSRQPSETTDLVFSNSSVSMIGSGNSHQAEIPRSSLQENLDDRSAQNRIAGEREKSGDLTRGG